MPAQRIVLVGVTGSGKTTLAARVAAVTGLPWTSTDDLVWEPGWRMVPEAERRRRFAALAAEERWVLDSLPTTGRDVLLARADLVVALDLPRWLTLLRLLRRTSRRVVTGEEVCNGNRETLRNVLGRDSILVWHARTAGERRRTIAALTADPAGPPVVRLRSRRDTEAWIRGLAGR